jgi:hypothetical protein
MDLHNQETPPDGPAAQRYPAYKSHAYGVDPGPPESGCKTWLQDSAFFQVGQWPDFEDRTFWYIDVNGKSPEITNHLAGVHFKVLEGVGSIATAHSVSQFNMTPDNNTSLLVFVPRAETYQYSGRFSAVLSSSLPPHPDYVKYDGEPLDRRLRRELDRDIRAYRQEQTKLQHRRVWEESIDEAVRKVGKLAFDIERYHAFLDHVTQDQ